MIFVSEDTALETHDYTEDGLKQALPPPMLSPPKLNATLTFECLFLMSETFGSSGTSENFMLLNSAPMYSRKISEVAGAINIVAEGNK